MPKILLEFAIHKRLVLSDGINPPLQVTTTRLEARVRLGKDPILRRVLIDTGAPLTMVSKSVWSLSEISEQIEWLLFPPGSATLALPTLNLAGRTYPYRVGRLTLQPWDVRGASLPAIAMIAQFLEDDPRPNHPPFAAEIIIGLTNGLLDGRYLIVKPSAADGKHAAWLTDEYPVPALMLAKAVL